MIKEVDPSLNPDVLQAPTDAEIAELSKRTTQAARERLEDAARGLLIAKMMAQDTTPWRELVAAYRASEPVRAEVEVVDLDGVPRVQVTYTERGFGLEGVAGRVHACTGDLVRALDLIEKERERNQVNGGNGGGRPSRKHEVSQSLERSIEKHTLNKMLKMPISWIVGLVEDDWVLWHVANDPPPAANTIRRVIESRLPDHPKLKRKNSKTRVVENQQS